MPVVMRSTKALLEHAQDSAGAAYASATWLHALLQDRDDRSSPRDRLLKQLACQAASRSYVVELYRCYKALCACIPSIPEIRVLLEPHKPKLELLKNARDSIVHAEDRIKGHRKAHEPVDESSSDYLVIDVVTGFEFTTTAEDGNLVTVTIDASNPNILMSIAHQALAAYEARSAQPSG